MPETLKDYLVKIGWDLDESGFKNATNKITSIKNKLDKVKGIKDGFKVASDVILGSLKVVNEAILDVVESTALLDYETEKQARLWWVSEQQARSYETALNALGETNADLLTMTNEQYRRLYELNQLGRSLEAPKELDDFLLLVRDINFEFSKLKVEFEYGKRWVAYYLEQFIGPDAMKVRDFLKRANNYIQENLPKIAEKVARFFEVFYRLGKAALVVAKSLYSVIESIFKFLNLSVPQGIALVSGFFLLLKTGPIGWFIAALTTLLLLIDDYMTWQRGGISAFDWSGFDSKFQNMKESFSDIKDDLGDIFKQIKDIFKTLGFESEKGAAVWIIKSIVEGIDSGLTGIHTMLQFIKGDFGGIADEADEWYDKFKGVATVIAGIAGFALGGPAGAVGGVLAIQAGEDIGSWLADKLGMSATKYNPDFDSNYNIPGISQPNSYVEDKSVTINMNGMSMNFANEQEATDWWNDMVIRRDYSSVGK